LNRSKQREQRWTDFSCSIDFLMSNIVPMHPLFQRASRLTETIIAAAIEVHRDKGPGLIESIYEWCLLTELGLRRLTCVNQKSVLIEYKGFTREEPLRDPAAVVHRGRVWRQHDTVLSPRPHESRFAPNGLSSEDHR